VPQKMREAAVDPIDIVAFNVVVDLAADERE
jgi:hypothetical protein